MHSNKNYVSFVPLFSPTVLLAVVEWNNYYREIQNQRRQISIKFSLFGMRLMLLFLFHWNIFSPCLYDAHHISWNHFSIFPNLLANVINFHIFSLDENCKLFPLIQLRVRAGYSIGFIVKFSNNLITKEFFSLFLLFHCSFHTGIKVINSLSSTWATLYLHMELSQQSKLNKTKRNSWSHNIQAT